MHFARCALEARGDRCRSREPVVDALIGMRRVWLGATDQATEVTFLGSREAVSGGFTNWEPVSPQ